MVPAACNCQDSKNNVCYQEELICTKADRQNGYGNGNAHGHCRNDSPPIVCLLRLCVVGSCTSRPEVCQCINDRMNDGLYSGDARNPAMNCQECSLGPSGQSDQ